MGHYAKRFDKRPWSAVALAGGVYVHYYAAKDLQIIISVFGGYIAKKDFRCVSAKESVKNALDGLRQRHRLVLMKDGAWTLCMI